jgi:4-carboxymuconolactone decarboxylase
MRTSLVAALFACFLVAPLAAQDRMPPIATDQLTDAQKKAADEFGQGRGYAVRGPFVPLIRSPEVMLRAKAMGDYLRFKSTETHRRRRQQCSSVQRYPRQTG